MRCGACLDVFDGVQHLLFDGEEFDPESSADVDEVLEELEQLPEEQAADEESILGDLAALEAALLPIHTRQRRKRYRQSCRNFSFEVIAPLELAEQAPAEDALMTKCRRTVPATIVSRLRSHWRVSLKSRRLPLSGVTPTTNPQPLRARRASNAAGRFCL